MHLLNVLNTAAVPPFLFATATNPPNGHRSHQWTYERMGMSVFVCVCEWTSFKYANDSASDL